MITFIPWVTTVEVMELINIRFRVHTWVCLTLKPMFLLPLLLLPVFTSNLSAVIKLWSPRCWSLLLEASLRDTGRLAQPKTPQNGVL